MLARTGKLQSAREACIAGRGIITDLTMKGLRRLINYQNTGNKVFEEQALFLFGHATHTLQDSFSPAHAIRSMDPNDNFDLQEVCYYDPRSTKEGVVEDVLHDHGSSHTLAALAQLFLPGKLGGLSRALKAADEEHARRFAMYSDDGIEDPSTIPVCTHKSVDVRDAIWIRTEHQYARAKSVPWDRWDSRFWYNPNATIRDHIRIGAGFYWLKKEKISNCAEEKNISFDVGKRTCMKHEGRLARAGTAKYLIAITQFISRVVLDIKTKGWAGLGIEFDGSDGTEASEKRFADFTEIFRTYLKNHLYEGNLNIDWDTRVDGAVSKSPNPYGLREIMAEGIIRCASLYDIQGQEAAEVL